jgi:hypothetical protein
LSDDVGDLPLRERVARYCAFEQMALRRAESTKSGALQESYLELARGWAALAEQIEQTIRAQEKT